MKNIIKALNEVMKSVAYVQKSSENKFHGYKYASESSLLESLRPAMIENGLILIPSIGNVSPIDDYGNTLITVEYTLAHTSGEVWPDKIVAAGCGNDRNKQGGVGDKGLYKAITGANKYLLFKLFQIETGDDPEKDETPAPAAAPVTQQARPEAKPAAKPAAKENGLKPIEYPEKFAPTAEDLDKYIAVFIGALPMARTEKEVRDFWKSEAKNRSLMALQPNDDDYKKLADACSKRIAELKGNENG